MTKLVLFIALTIVALQTATAQITCAVLNCPEDKVCQMVTSPFCFRLPCSQPRCIERIDKEGTCPEVSVGRSGGGTNGNVEDCSAECKADNNCPGTEKCCSAGCKMMCMEPRAPEPEFSTPGFCPMFSDFTLPSCDNPECTEDVQCEPGSKCCAYGCSFRCMKPLNTTTPIVKVDMCPSRIPDIPDVNCTIGCTQDTDCRVHQKCCLRGCSTQCSSPVAIQHLPPEPEGYCPTPSGNIIGPCQIDCRTSERDCRRGEKCCDFGCSRACVNPVISPPELVKRGDCPQPTPEIILSNNCTNECRFDDSCSGSQKCCQYGCASLCREPGPGSIDIEPVPTPPRLQVPAVFEKVGTCKTRWASRLSCPSRNHCGQDGDCSGVRKCCKIGCMKICANVVMPRSNPRMTKPMFCPMFQASPVGARCRKTGCSSDKVCPGDKKCCNDGCNTLCYEPVSTPPPAKAGSCPALPVQFTTYRFSAFRRCTDQCKTDYNCHGTSKCCQHTMSCKRCLGAVGIPPAVSAAVYCPNFPADASINSTCELTCTSKTECSGGQICCPYGCGAKCVTPTTIRPRLKPGFCPNIFVTTTAVSSISLRFCLDTCTSDNDCSGDEKCCAYGCSRRCTPSKSTRPVMTRPGFCPTTSSSSILSGTSDECTASCSSDWACRSREKCCYNGCKRECMVVVDQAPAAKVGFCPKSANTRVTFANFISLKCGLSCNSDQMCPGDLKCCKINQCRHGCVAMLDSPPSELKLGFCPAPVSTNESCSRSCSSDLDCNGNQKCCFQGGCIQKCMEASSALPNQKAGVCPNVPALSVKQCISERSFCNSDHACPASLKCCFGGCGLRCMNVESSIVSTKPGFCPISTSVDPSDSCLVNCSTDDVCPGGQKCCSKGCGISCVNATSIPPRDKPGFCPFIPVSLSPVCRLTCPNDSICPGSMKCCQNGCSRECYTPVAVPPPVSKAGYCPTAAADATCDKSCNSDIACPGNQKCCHLSCGMSCVASSSSPPAAKAGFCPFVHPNVSTMCLKTCSSDSSCDGDTKCCSYGRCSMRCMQPSSRAHFTEKAGLCPDSSVRTPITTSILCRTDFACSGEQKCCKIGTSLKCTDPKIMASQKAGVCPAIPFDIFPTCYSPQCSDDRRCTGKKKCCKFGCNSICINSVEMDSLVSNPGYCPYVSPNVFQPCTSPCTSDASCGDGKKCCQSGCSMRCMNSQPFSPKSVKPGNCPSPESQKRMPFFVGNGGNLWFRPDEKPTQETFAYRNCLNDGQCPGADKCCRANIGGTECLTPT